jgi:hypothetical protein
MVDLLDNFLNPLKLFMGIGKRFHEIAITEDGRGQERKINGGPATANQVRDGVERPEAKVFAKRERYKKRF